MIHCAFAGRADRRWNHYEEGTESPLLQVKLFKIVEFYVKTSHRFIKKYVDRWDSPLAFLCWLPLLGDIFAVGLGFFRVRFTYVAMWMLIGKILRYTIWGVLTLWGISLF